MDHAVGVNVVEAPRDVNQLVTVEATCGGGTKKGSQERPALVVGLI